MSISVDRQTYVGQYASRKLLQKKMDNSNRQRLRALYSQLGTLLNKRKALNSKVTSRYFELFREAIDSGAEAHDTKSRLNKLEQSLKQEGLFKNVKADFSVLKKEILGCIYYTESPYASKERLPGITVAKDKTFYVAPKGNEDQAAAASGSSGSKHGQVLSTDDMKVLNSAIGKLFRHLQINGKDQTDLGTRSTEHSYKDETSSQKETVNILTLSHVHGDDSLHDIVLKIKNFEKEFQRQKVQQQRELMRLQEEIKRINKNSNELRKENERIKGVQPILSKAKGRQVERIEERYRSEKKGMEEKINELESGMKKNLASLLQGHQSIRTQIKEEVEGLVSSINNIHHMVHGHYHDVHITMATYQDADDTEILPTREIMSMLKSVTSGVQMLKTQTVDVSSKTEELAAWKKGFKEVEREISRFTRAFSEEKEDLDLASSLSDNDPSSMAYQCKSKLQKTRDNINTRLRGVDDSASIIRKKDREIGKFRKKMEDLLSEISKVHDHVMAVQIQDISITMPKFESRTDHGDRSDGSADELPEADRQEQANMLDKLRQVDTMVTHFQQLITDRTEILNKMENDMLPLKIRVNRLHEDISKAMRAGTSPEHDPADDIIKPRRAFSPGQNPTSNMFSKEINNMLTKLTKMELTIRQLLEQHDATTGRASI